MKYRNVSACAGMSFLAVALAACSGGEGGGSDEAPKIEPFLWAEKPAYCAFLPSGTKFNVADRSTWEFVFVTQPEPGDDLAAAPALMQLDGRQVRLMRNLSAPGSGPQTWVYRDEGSMLEIELKLESPAIEMGGSTGGPQNATLRVRGPVRGKVQEVRGGCGL
ncbi:MAG: hypothetical protein R3C13_00680 [Hyphomonas sp.]|uniref:hypothetical protein n=1 Tax=Hyphomonas sp. TaxID=87 RepID=UPI0035288E84